MRDAVARWESRLQPLLHLTEPVAPSEALWGRIAASIGAEAAQAAQRHASARTPADRAAMRRRPAWREQLGFWRAMTAMATAASLVLAILLFVQARTPVTPRYVVVLLAQDGRDPAVLLQALDERHIRLVTLGAIEVPADRALELWTHPGGAPGVVSLGLITPGQARTISLDTLPPLVDQQGFAISLEPRGGSPTGQPTGPVRYTGRVLRAS
ncbi:MAG: anti-sigma factor [Burkholderiaceae bacterium]